MKFSLLIITFLYTSNLHANELLGRWSKSDGNKYLVVLFEETNMTQATSQDMKNNAMSIDVKYVKLNNSFGIEMLDKSGKKVGAMMAVFEDKDTIKFGAPGSAFIKLERE